MLGSDQMYIGDPLNVLTLHSDGHHCESFVCTAQKAQSATSTYVAAASTSISGNEQVSGKYCSGNFFEEAAGCQMNNIEPMEEERVRCSDLFNQKPRRKRFVAFVRDTVHRHCCFGCRRRDLTS